MSPGERERESEAELLVFQLHSGLSSQAAPADILVDHQSREDVDSADRDVLGGASGELGGKSGRAQQNADTRRNCAPRQLRAQRRNRRVAVERFPICRLCLSKACFDSEQTAKRFQCHHVLCRSGAVS